MFHRILCAKKRMAFVGVLIAGAVAARWASRPLATLLLPNGDTYALRRVTFGHEHTFKLSPPPEMSVWQTLRHIFWGPSATQKTQTAGPVFHFESLFSIGAGQALPFRIGDIRVYWEDGRLDTQEQRLLGHCTLWTEPVFPRRQKTFRAQVYIGGQWHDWELPNPVYGQAFPEWKAESLPARRVIGDFEYTAKGWKRGNRGLQPDYDLLYRGIPVPKEAVFDHSAHFKDATGNASRNPLSHLEPAWNVRHEIIAGIGYPLSADHALAVASFVVPPTGQPLIQSGANFPGGGRSWIALLPAGQFELRDGVAVKPMPVAPDDQGDLKLALGSDGHAWSAQVYAQKPSMLIAVEGPEINAALALPNGEFSYAANGRIKKFNLPWTYARSQVIVRGRRLTAIMAECAEAPGTQIDLRWFKLEQFAVDLFLKPPTNGEIIDVGIH